MLRYLAPSLVTFTSIVFATLSIGCALEGRYADAGWFVMFSVLTDKLDGFVARLVKGTSDLGVQLDSFADLLSFGVAPSTLFYSFFSRAPDSPFRTGAAHVVLSVVCIAWVLAVVFRLARYNLVGDDPRCRNLFFGIPTTLAGGFLVSLFLAHLKYGPANQRDFAGDQFAEPRMLGSLSVEGDLFAIWPALILLGALLMVSTLRVPKLGASRSKALKAFLLANMLAGFVFGFSRMLPEYLAIISLIWIVVALCYSALSSSARALSPPKIFPVAVAAPLVVAATDELTDEPSAAESSSPVAD